MAVDRRLERARDQEQSGAERMEGGTLVFHAAAGIAVGLLLPGGSDAGRLEVAESDLRRLADGVRRRPQMVQLVQANTQEASLESVGSVGLRLAYQLERMLDAQVVVAACESGNELPGEAPTTESVRVIGVSGRGDRRLLDTTLPADSDLARVARGEVDSLFSEGDPLGGVVADRRQHPSAVVVLPMRAGERTVGGVALWPPGGREPTGGARAEILAALANAAPRVVTAMEADRLKEKTRLDPLTGLLNRRGLDVVLNRVDVGDGALIYADLDKFKQLNDRMGHPAGDAALMHFARIIRDQIRTGDIAARVGGEEFAIWLPGARLETGYRIAERIRIRLNTTPWDWQGKAWALERELRRGRLPGHQPGGRGPDPPGGRGAVRREEQREEPGGAGGGRWGRSGATEPGVSASARPPAEVQGGGGVRAGPPGAAGNGGAGAVIFPGSIPGGDWLRRV